jgi:Mor family transcriptional regulator
MQTKEMIKRNNQMYKNYLKGKTFTELGKEYNLSSERIRQICNRLKRINEKKSTPII